MEEFELDPKKQKLIWDNEHITFKIEKRFGKAFLAALLKRDDVRLQSFLLGDFQGKVIASRKGTTRQKAPLVETRLSAQSEGTRNVEGEGLVATLLETLAPFANVERKMLRVLKIQQDAQTKNRWKTKVLLGFVGSDKDGNRLLHQSEHWMECQFDEEKVIDSPALIRRWETEYEVLRQCAGRLLEEVTETYNLSSVGLIDNWDLEPTEVWQNRLQFAVEDYNKDGFLDIAVSALGQKPLLLESIQGKRFENVAAKKGLTKKSSFGKIDYVAGWLDYDNDGYPDLVMNGRLYHNLSGERFEDVTTQSGLVFDRECMGCTVVDYDCDGRLDLYVLYQRDYKGPPAKQEKWVDDEESGQFNQLWRNEGNGKFRNVTKEANAGGGKRHTHAATWLFYDDDHYPDVYIANDFGRNVLLRNRGDGTFEDISSKSGAASFATSMGVASGDVDNDGRTDLYVANMFSKMGRRIIGQLCDEDYPTDVFSQIQGSCAGSQLYLRPTGQTKYTEDSVSFGVNKVGWAYGPAMFDLDGDSWLDLYATTGFMSFTPGEADG
ncbi:MAG: FG-GAP repeat domain-containing protein [Gemmataceae bacterium]